MGASRVGAVFVLPGSHVRVGGENGHTHQLKKQKKGNKICIMHTVTFLHSPKYSMLLLLTFCLVVALHIILSGNCNEGGESRFEIEPAKQEEY